MSKQRIDIFDLQTAYDPTKQYLAVITKRDAVQAALKSAVVVLEELDRIYQIESELHQIELHEERIAEARSRITLLENGTNGGPR
ncbi:hypothetical protein [Mycolicibacterium llatzerense]|uniref:hypothetical protein n=1 Tax=Mycolicibacterium llatzerense TaxID=280871 RepID=UPI0021B62CE1|nr:hypothetical protein [Mycolicibacterium llatzerense]MCT7361209.1 hypothetical protein [Mycolicibacterium llatzerense]